METKQNLYAKIMMPVEFARDYIVVTDAQRSKTVQVTSLGGWGYGEQIPPYLCEFVPNLKDSYRTGEVVKINCDWNVFLDVLKKNEKEYEILKNEVII